MHRARRTAGEQADDKHAVKHLRKRHERRIRHHGKGRNEKHSAAPLMYGKCASFLSRTHRQKEKRDNFGHGDGEQGGTRRTDGIARIARGEQ